MTRMSRTDKIVLTITAVALLPVVAWIWMDTTEVKHAAEFHQKIDGYHRDADIARDRADLYAEAEEALHLAARAVTIYQDDPSSVTNIVRLAVPITGLWLGPCGLEEHRKVAAVKAQLDEIIRAKRQQ